MYWVTQKLPQIYTSNHATFPIQIRKIQYRFAVAFGSPSNKLDPGQLHLDPQPPAQHCCQLYLLRCSWRTTTPLPLLGTIHVPVFL